MYCLGADGADNKEASVLDFYTRIIRSKNGDVISWFFF